MALANGKGSNKHPRKLRRDPLWPRGGRQSPFIAGCCPCPLRGGRHAPGRGLARGCRYLALLIAGSELGAGSSTMAKEAGLAAGVAAGVSSVGSVMPELLLPPPPPLLPPPLPPLLLLLLPSLLLLPAHCPLLAATAPFFTAAPTAPNCSAVGCKASNPGPTGKPLPSPRHFSFPQEPLVESPWRFSSFSMSFSLKRFGDPESHGERTSENEAIGQNIQLQVCRQQPRWVSHLSRSSE
jgi:hypothetical protein